ncbi:MAG: toxic anion resistance protein [Clostridia bacterium]|nr:toxic anion resistance protein [Clostridia bacterium]MBR6809107.1 toxic anion resistance protein [Clostridia bacterium]
MSEQNAQAVATETKPAVPVLTLTPEMGDKQVIESAMEMLNELKAPAAPESADEAVEKLADGLTEAEKAQVAAFAKTIDVTNPDHVMLYGAEAQKKISTFADTVLGNVQTADTGDVGDILANLITELKGFNTAGDKPKGIRGWFFTARKRIAAIQAKYEDVSVNVEAISKNLEDHQVQLLKDVAMFNHLYEQNLEYFHELTLYIVAGEERLAEVRATTLQQLRDKAEQTGDAMDAQAAKDLADQCDRFEKKLHDLKLTRQVSLQMAPQIRLLQNNNALLVERIQSTLVNTLPLWKNQMVLALGLHHSQQAMKAQRAVTDMTNDLLKKNAETLKMGTIETAKESERGIIDMETLVQTNQSLIDTIDEVKRIHTEGRQKRFEAEKQLAEMEKTLKKKLLEM